MGRQLVGQTQTIRSSLHMVGLDLVGTDLLVGLDLVVLGLDLGGLPDLGGGGA